jgi:hypothetical protein
MPLCSALAGHSNPIITQGYWCHSCAGEGGEWNDVHDLPPNSEPFIARCVSYFRIQRSILCSGIVVDAEEACQNDLV